MSSQKPHLNHIQPSIKQNGIQSTILNRTTNQSKFIVQVQSKSVMDEARQQLRKLEKNRNNKSCNQTNKYSQKQHRNKQIEQFSNLQLTAESGSSKEITKLTEFKKLHQKLDCMKMKMAELKQNIQKKKQQCNNHNQLQLSALVTQQPEKTGLHYSNYNNSTQRNIYYISEVLRAYQDERSLAREHINSTLAILKMINTNKKPTDQQIKKKEVDLPMRAGHKAKKTLVFDLDQTLVHCNYSQTDQCDIRLPIKTTTGNVVQAGINVRPYARQILSALSKHFQIVIFTASHSSYANVVIDFIDQKKEWVHHRLFRQHCLPTGHGLYIKDLRVMNRELKDIILVDNAAYSYVYQLQNAVPILPYYHGQEDCQLVRLQEYLMKLRDVDDVREEMSGTFKLHLYRNYFDRPQELVEQLYIPQ